MSENVEDIGPENNASQPSARLLIGERDPFMRHALKKTLAPRFSVTFAEDGVDLLQRAQQDPPHLILLEALLPVKDGFQVCRELKSNPLTQRIPVVFFTLLSAEERARLAGGDAFLLKPLREAKLIETLHRLLQSIDSEASHGTHSNEYPRFG